MRLKNILALATVALLCVAATVTTKYRGAFVGDGSGLTGLPGAQLSGTVAVERLPGLTTNIQYTISGVITNTLCFTNGVLMGVTQP